MWNLGKLEETPSVGLWVAWLRPGHGLGYGCPHACFLGNPGVAMASGEGLYIKAPFLDTETWTQPNSLGQ